jgi:hypothetical protein
MKILSCKSLIAGEDKNLLVPKGGLEPPHPCEYMDLNHARLPIPPLRHEERSAVRSHDLTGHAFLLQVDCNIRLWIVERALWKTLPEDLAKPTGRRQADFSVLFA